MLRLFNTLTRQEEPFAPLRDNTARMYACGLTVYARGHIGNFRTFVCVDILRRTLKYLSGHQVKGVINYTDVDDKTIAGAQKAGQDLRTYTSEWIAAFREDCTTLGIETPEEMPRATDEVNLRAMGEMVQALERNGHAYRRDGSVYFRIASLPQYGRLAHLDHAGLEAGARVDVDEYSKTMPAISCCGRPRRKASRRGTMAPAPGGQAGTSSARRWRCAPSTGRRSTSMPAASI